MIDDFYLQYIYFLIIQILWEIRQELVKHALTKNTQKSYGTYFPYWKQFCDWMKIETLSISENNILNFIAWCFRNTHLNADLASKAVTATISFHKDNGISFDRKQHPSIKRLLEGFYFQRPPDKRPKLPLSEFHIRSIFLFCVNTNEYMDLLPACAVLIGYSLLLRPGEIGYKPHSSEKNLYNKSINWHPNYDSPNEISIEVDASKTNRRKNRTEIIYAYCNCDKNNRIIPCPVHLLKHWIIMRNAYHKEKQRPRDFLFIHKDGSPFSYNHLNNWLQNAIVIVAKKLNIKLDASKYPAHSLRQGKCTDMARHGYPSWRIERAGRWQSKMWKKTYINTDWRDIAKISGLSVTELLDNIKTNPITD